VQRAFVRSLEIIGEASRKVSAEFRAEHPHVEACAPSSDCGRPRDLIG
jgi:uncharacterized protein with HEPN domain